MATVLWQMGMTLADLEKEAILECYRSLDQNKAATARALGIDVRTLYDRLEKYEQDRLGALAAGERERDFQDKNRRAAREAFDVTGSGFSSGDYTERKQLAEDRGSDPREAKDSESHRSEASEGEESPGPNSEGGSPVEPPSEDRSQRPLSVQKREKVQKMSSK